MSERLAVTLAIPCFNAASFIAGALRSVQRQTEPPDEILVVDDGSVDDSVGVVRGFPQAVLLSHGGNRGIAAARNTAWRHARGDIVVYIDADTRAHPRLLEVLKRGYTADDVAGVGGRGIEVIQKNHADRWRREILFQGWGEAYRPEVAFLFGLCASYRVRVLDQLGGFDPSFRLSGEDIDLSFRARRAGFRLAYHPDAVVDHLRSDDERSIRHMTYRHCYGGFRAMRVNRCYQNKLPARDSARVFLRQVLRWKTLPDARFAALSISLHWTVLRAWFDSRRGAIGRGGAEERLGWEGHVAPGVERTPQQTAGNALAGPVQAGRRAVPLNGG